MFANDIVKRWLRSHSETFPRVLKRTDESAFGNQSVNSFVILLSDTVFIFYSQSDPRDIRRSHLPVRAGHRKLHFVWIMKWFFYRRLRNFPRDSRESRERSASFASTLCIPRLSIVPILGTASPSFVKYHYARMGSAALKTLATILRSDLRLNRNVRFDATRPACSRRTSVSWSFTDRGRNVALCVFSWHETLSAAVHVVVSTDEPFTNRLIHVRY